MRFRTLSATNQSLVQMLVDTSDQVEAEQQKLQDINQEHTQSVLVSWYLMSAQASYFLL